jgi:hypothetical protein
MRPKLLWLGVFVLLLALYTVRLGGIPNGALSAQESANLRSTISLQEIVKDPFFLPLNTVRWAAQKALTGHQAYAVRLPSVLFGLIAIVSLLYIARRWYGPRTLVFALLIFASSAWFLHIARLGVNDIAYLTILPVLLAMHLLLYEYPEKRFLFFLWLVIVTLVLYVPGGIWFVLLSIWWQRRDIAEAWKALSWAQRPLLFTVGAIVIAPLVYGGLQHFSSSFALAWLGAPTDFGSWTQPLKNLVAALAFIFVRTPADPERWLGKLPLLDAFLAVSFLSGCLFYLGHRAAERTRLLATYSLLGLLLCAGGGPVTRSVLVPLLYLIALGGIAFLLHQWLKLFPKNILAKRTGIALIYTALVLSCTYNLRHYFVAWPHNPATRAAFSRQV